MNSQMYKDTHLGNLETTGLVPIIGLPFLDCYINGITQHVVFWVADFYLEFFVELFFFKNSFSLNSLQLFRVLFAKYVGSKFPNQGLNPHPFY